MAAVLAAAPEDPEEVVGFLMGKFSALIDRVQAAEGQEETARQHTAALESRVSAAKERRGAATSNLQASLKSQREAAGRACSELSGSRSEAEAAKRELSQARRANAALQQQCDALGVRCQEEHSNLVDATGMAAQSDEAWAACEVERERLRAEVAALRCQLSSAEEELAAQQEMEQHRRSDLRALEEKIAETGRSWQMAARRAEVQHEEVCNALKTVTLYRERLDSARHSLLHKEEELQAADAEVEGLQQELAGREEEVAAMARSLQRLGELKGALAAASQENSEVRSTLEAALLSTQACFEEGTGLANRQRDAQARLSSTDQRLAAAEAEVRRGRERLSQLREDLRQCEERRRSMEDGQEGAGCAGLNLQSELQRVFSQMEQERAEAEEAQAACEELQKRLRSSEPALEAARRRALELQGTLEDAGREALRTRGRKEKLMREVAQCREKMRGLRRRHSQLSERGQALERRLLRSSGAFGGTAGFAAAAVAFGGQPGARGEAAGRQNRLSRGTLLAPPPSTVLPMKSQEASPRQKSPSGQRSRPGAAAAPTGAPPYPVAKEGLGYLKQWIELEEARLGAARTPPKPCPKPTSQPPSPNAARSTPPPRSRAAVLPEPCGPRGGEGSPPVPPPVALVASQQVLVDVEGSGG